MTRAMRFLVAGLALGTLASSGCTDSGKPTTDATTESRTGEATAQQPVELRGTVVNAEWTKSRESYSAGGSEYFVLSTSTTTDGESRTILRPSERVTEADLRSFVGRRVVVTGVVIPRSPDIEIPEHIDYAKEPEWMGQFPVTTHFDKDMKELRDSSGRVRQFRLGGGGGFQVMKIVADE